MARERPIPFTVIGGFLGAGKTTLLNRILAQSDGVRYVVLINDFASLNIDAALIRDHDGRTLTLTNGCICCSIGDRLIEALVELLSQPDPGDHILVEVSGVGDPRRIADIAVIDRDLRLDSVLVLADAAEIRRQVDDRFVGDIVRRQLGAADILIVNKIDLVQPQVLMALGGWLAEAAPGAIQLSACRGELPVAALLGQWQGSWRGQAKSSPEHHDARFRHETLQWDNLLERETFLAAIAALPATVIRGKGFVRFTDRPEAPELFQMVGRRWELVSTSRWATLTDNCRLVFIGTPEMPDLQPHFPIVRRPGLD